LTARWDRSSEAHRLRRPSDSAGSEPPTSAQKRCERPDGPEQGIALLHHGLEEFGVTVTSTTPPAENLQRVDRVVCVELDITGDTDGRQLARQVRAALEAFASSTAAPAFDLIEA